MIHIPLDAHGMSIDLLEEQLDRLAAQGQTPKLIYTIPNFHNPGGVTMSRHRRERLVALAAERDVLIVEDNPYGPVRYEGEALPSLWELDGGAGGVIYLSTFSKILAPGMRIGWVAAPAPVLRKMNLGKQAIDLCSSTMSQRFIVEYLRRYDWREHVARLNGIYRQRRDAMLRRARPALPAGGHLDASRGRAVRLGDPAGLHPHRRAAGAGHRAPPGGVRARRSGVPRRTGTQQHAT